MDFDMEQLGVLGIDMQTGIDYTGGKDKYISALQRFYKSSGKNKANIHEFMDSNDMENLSITVHALKSNSKMIGAAGLSSMFETLELASRNNDSDTVNANIEKTLQEYDRILTALKPLGESETCRAAGEISGAEAKDIADRLLAALDDFDDDLSAELAGKLSGYPFRITQRGRLREAITLIGEFMYDEAADIIKEIIPAIE